MDLLLEATTIDCIIDHVKHHFINTCELIFKNNFIIIRQIDEDNMFIAHNQLGAKISIDPKIRNKKIIIDKSIHMY